MAQLWMLFHPVSSIEALREWREKTRLNSISKASEWTQLYDFCTTRWTKIYDKMWARVDQKLKILCFGYEVFRDGMFQRSHGHIKGIFFSRMSSLAASTGRMKIVSSVDTLHEEGMWNNPFEEARVGKEVEGNAHQKLHYRASKGKRCLLWSGSNTLEASWEMIECLKLMKGI